MCTESVVYSECSDYVCYMCTEGVMTRQAGDKVIKYRNGRKKQQGRLETVS